MTEQAGVKTADFSDEVSHNFLIYAEDVIKNRAIPDIRDGLKPVHRHILWAMWEMGCGQGSPYRKSARIVGDTMGKYHPHGDAAIYEAMVRMAQPFAMNIPLVDGQGNFGNIDGDNAAAPRYTEARMSKFAEHVLFADIKDDTVDMIPNYDGKEMEPVVLPARIPLILMTAAAGIAVGMATNILPHNISEICNGILALVKNPVLTSDDLLKLIPAPDFPLGGLIHNKDIKQIYETGRGSFQYRACSDFECEGKNREIIIRTVPYMANKSDLVQKIGELVRDGKVEGVSGVRDESTKAGIRVCIEIDSKADQNAVMNSLYKQTDFQCGISMNMVAICNKKPQTIGVLGVLNQFLDFRRETIKRRTKNRKDKAESRLELVEGILIAVKNSDRVIEIVKKSEAPLKKLISEFKMTERQADHVFNMALRRFSTQDVQSLKDEEKQLKDFIKDAESILATKKRVDEIIVQETEEIADKFGAPRKTNLVSDFEHITVKDTIKEQEVVLIFMSDGTVKATPVEDYRLIKKRGSGFNSGVKVPDGVFPIFVSQVNTHDDVMLITDLGNRYRMRAYDVPAIDKGRMHQHIKAYIPLFKENERVVSVTKSAVANDECLVILGSNGLVKKQSAETLNKGRDNTTLIYDTERGGKVVGAVIAKVDDDVIVGTAQALFLRKSLGEIREVSSRNSAGIQYMKLQEKDKVISLSVVRKTGFLLTISKHGFGKRTTMEEFAVKGTGGKKGVVGSKLVDNDELVFAKTVMENDEESGLLIMSSQNKSLRLHFSAVPESGRATRGNHLTRFGENEWVTTVSIE